MPVLDLVQFRSGTAAQWNSADPVLALGEPGFESNTGQFKIGDGTTAWSALAYAGGAGDIADKLGLTAVPLKTADYNALAGEFVPCSTSGGAFNVALPTAPEDGTVVAVKIVTQGGTNGVGVLCSGTDTFNRSGGATTMPLVLLGQAAIFQYRAANTVWYIVLTDVPLGQLDLRFAPQANPTFSGHVTVPTPTSSTDAVTKAYADALASGFKVKSPPAACATTGNIVLSGEQTIDGHLTATDRVLVKDQTAPAENGIWRSGPGAWTRTTDCDASAEFTQAYIAVTAGPVNGGSSWVQQTPNPVVGTDPIVWGLFQSAAGLEHTSNKDVAGGYPSLDGATKVPIAELPTGTTGATVPFGNDARFSNARAPLAHKTTHQDGGDDELALDASQVAGLIDALAAAVHQAGNESITGQKTITGSKGITLDTSDANPLGQFRLYGTSTKTGLTSASPAQFLAKLIAGDPAYVGDVAHDWQSVLFLVTYLANGAALSAGSIAFGDAIYANNTETSLAQLASAGRPYAINAEAGSNALKATDAGSGGTVTYTASGLTDTSKAWATNQWANRWVQIGLTPSTAVRGFISSNTATTLTLNALGWCTTTPGDVSQTAGATTPANGSAYHFELSPATALHAKVFSDGNGLYINRVAGAGTVQELLRIVDSAGLTGALARIFHDTSAFVGNALEIDTGNGAGSHAAGNLIVAKLSGQQKFAVATDGSISSKNKITLVGTQGDATQSGAWHGNTVSGPPTSGTFTVGDWVTAHNGHIFVCTVGGTPGTWVDVGGGAPTTADYLVATAQPGLSGEIVVGPTPGGELGGTWAAPTVDATHSGSSHAAVQAAAEATAAAADAAHVAAADPHTGYQQESEKGQPSGYAPLDGSGLLADSFIPSGIARDAETTAAVNAAVSALVAGAPGTLDTLDEIAAALGDDPNFATTISTLIGTKVAKSLYDANTILAANSDDTPAALTIGEQTFLGRITGGNIAALTPAQGRTLLGVVIGSNVQAWDADLDSLSTVGLTAAGLALLDDVDAAAQRTTLGLGAAALLATPIPIASGGSGQTTALAAFDALAPTTTRGDITYRGATTSLRLAKGAADTILTMGASDPAWSATAKLTGLGIGIAASTVTAVRVTRADTVSTDVIGQLSQWLDTRTFSVANTATGDSNSVMFLSGTPVLGTGIAVGQYNGLRITGLPTTTGADETGSFGAGGYNAIATHWDSPSHADVTIARLAYLHGGSGGTAATGVTTDFVGVEVEILAFDPTAITNAIGLRIADGNALNGTNNWAFQIGNYKSQHMGLFGLGGAAITTAPTYGLHMMATTGDAGSIFLPEVTTTPTNPPSSAGVVHYHKADKVCYAFNDAGTMRYHTMTLSGATTPKTWVNSTSAP